MLHAIYETEEGLQAMADTLISESVYDVIVKTDFNDDIITAFESYVDQLDSNRVSLRLETDLSDLMTPEVANISSIHEFDASYIFGDNLFEGEAEINKAQRAASMKILNRPVIKSNPQTIVGSDDYLKVDKSKPATKSYQASTVTPPPSLLKRARTRLSDLGGSIKKGLARAGGAMRDAPGKMMNYAGKKLNAHRDKVLKKQIKKVATMNAHGVAGDSKQYHKAQKKMFNTHANIDKTATKRNKRIERQQKRVAKRK